MLDGLADLLSPIIGVGVGNRLRRSYDAKKRARAVAGSSVRLRCRARPSGAPSWLLWRGALVAGSKQVVWRATLRRWRRADLEGPVVLGSHAEDSVADGQRIVVVLAGGRSVDQLVLSPDAGAVALEVLDSAYG